MAKRITLPELSGEFTYVNSIGELTRQIVFPGEINARFMATPRDSYNWRVQLDLGGYNTFLSVARLYPSHLEANPDAIKEWQTAFTKRCEDRLVEQCLPK